MSIFSKGIHKRDEDRNKRLLELNRRYASAKEQLTYEQMRGELIKMKKQFGYMSRLKSFCTDNYDWYLKHAAGDCCESLTFPYENYPDYSPELSAGMGVLKQAIITKINQIDPMFSIHPVDTLCRLANEDTVLVIIEYIDELITETEMHTQ